MELDYKHNVQENLLSEGACDRGLLQVLQEQPCHAFNRLGSAHNWQAIPGAQIKARAGPKDTDDGPADSPQGTQPSVHRECFYVTGILSSSSATFILTVQMLEEKVALGKRRGLNFCHKRLVFWFSCKYGRVF